MSRYIDADALIDNFAELTVDLWLDSVEEAEIVSLIGNSPSIDIVRCKECRHSFINENHPQKPRICGLTKMCGTTKDDWFCADGERREP